MSLHGFIFLFSSGVQLFVCLNMEGLGFCQHKCFRECLSILFYLKLWTVARQLWRAGSLVHGWASMEQTLLCVFAFFFFFFFITEVSIDTKPGQSREFTAGDFTATLKDFV